MVSYVLVMHENFGGSTVISHLTVLDSSVIF